MTTKRIFLLSLLAFCLFGVSRMDVFANEDEEKTQRSSLPNDNQMVVAEPVDLGLSVLWASWNVGANTPEGDGNYYAWGEIEPKNYYDWNNYSLCKGKVNTCEDLDEISGTQYDVAHVKWGGKWRMPTRAEVKELCNRCNTTWTVKNGRLGVKLWRKIKGKEVSIFLPASGYRCQEALYDLGNGKGPLKFGAYWSGTQRNLRGGRAFALEFKAQLEFQERAGWGDSERRLGFPIRPVMDK